MPPSGSRRVSRWQCRRRLLGAAGLPRDLVDQTHPQIPNPQAHGERESEIHAWNIPSPVCYGPGRLLVSGFAGIPMMSHAQAQAATAPEGDPLYLQWSSQGPTLQHIATYCNIAVGCVALMGNKPCTCTAGQTGGERPSLTPTVSPVAPRILPGGNQGALAALART